METGLTAAKIGIVFLLFGSLGLSNSFARFKHPGIFNTKPELDLIKAKISAGEQPWKSAFEKIQASNPTSRTAKPKAKIPGSSDSKHRKDMDEFVLDGEYAYASTLLWYFTGEKKYADHAIEILNAWSIFEDIPMSLYLTWAAPHYLNSAEILKHIPGSGWQESDIEKFSAMVRNYMLPKIRPPAKWEFWPQNHGATTLESHVAISIFLDDEKEFDFALSLFDKHLETYIYYGKKGFADGQSLETCRDLNHTKMGVLGIMHNMQSAFNQGVDLWYRERDRLSQFAEMHAGWMTGETKVPSTICGGKGIWCQGNVSWGNPSGRPPCNETSWEILYNHLSTRLGLSLPITKKMNERNRPLGGINRRNMKWETLLHANMAYSLSGNVNSVFGRYDIERKPGLYRHNGLYLVAPHSYPAQIEFWNFTGKKIWERRSVSKPYLLHEDEISNGQGIIRLRSPGYVETLLLP